MTREIGWSESSASASSSPAKPLPLIPSLSKDLNQTQLGKAVFRSAHPEPVEGSQSFVSNYERAQRRLDLPDLILVAGRWEWSRWSCCGG
jgi:hypothetical protein